jgi:hypothetical protein
MRSYRATANIEFYALLSNSTRCYQDQRATRAQRAAIALYALLSSSTRCYQAQRAAIALYALLSSSTRCDRSLRAAIKLNALLSSSHCYRALRAAIDMVEEKEHRLIQMPTNEQIANVLCTFKGDAYMRNAFAYKADIIHAQRIRIQSRHHTCATHSHTKPTSYMRNAFAYKVKDISTHSLIRGSTLIPTTHTL